MKVRVISLVKRADRKQHFSAANANKIEAHFTEAIDGEFVSFKDLDEWCVGLT